MILSLHDERKDLGVSSCSFCQSSFFVLYQSSPLFFDFDRSSFDDIPVQSSWSCLLLVVFLCLFPRLLFFLLLLIFYEWRAAETDKTRPLSLLQTSLLKSTDTSLGYFSLLFILVSLQLSLFPFVTEAAKGKKARIQETFSHQTNTRVSLSRHPSSSSIIDRLRQTEQELNRKQIAA